MTTRVRLRVSLLMGAFALAACGGTPPTEPERRPQPMPDRTLPNPRPLREPGTGGSGRTLGSPNGASTVGVGKDSVGSPGVVDSEREPPPEPVDQNHSNTPHSQTY